MLLVKIKTPFHLKYFHVSFEFAYIECQMDKRFASRAYGIGNLNFVRPATLYACIQLFVKACATMPIRIMGSDSLSLLG